MSSSGISFVWRMIGFLSKCVTLVETKWCYFSFYIFDGVFCSLVRSKCPMLSIIFNCPLYYCLQHLRFQNSFFGKFKANHRLSVFIERERTFRNRVIVANIGYNTTIESTTQTDHANFIWKKRRRSKCISVMKSISTEICCLFDFHSIPLFGRQSPKTVLSVSVICHFICLYTIQINFI